MAELVCNDFCLDFVTNSTGPICSLIALVSTILGPSANGIPKIHGDNQSFIAQVPFDDLRCSLIVVQSPIMQVPKPMKVLTPAHALNQFYGHSWNYTVEVFVIYHADLMAKLIICPASDPRLESFGRGTELISNPKVACPSILAKKKKPVRASYVGLPPYVFHHEDMPPTGVDMDQLKFFSEALNFTMTLVEETAFMAKDPKTGQLIGLIPSVSNGSADIGSGHLMMNLETYRLVDFTHYSYTADVHIVAPKPKRIKSYWNATRPFSGLIWSGLASASSAMTLAVVVTLVLEKRVAGSSTADRKWGIAASLLWLFGVALSQSCPPNRPKRRSLAILVLSWIFFTMAAEQFYQSNLRANMIAVDYEKPIDTVQDLLDRKMILYLPRLYTFIDQFKSSGSQALRIMGAKVEAGGYHYDFDPSGYPIDDEIFATGNAFIMTKLMAWSAFPTLAERRNGSLPYMISKSSVIPAFCAPVVPKGVPYLEELTRVGQILDQAGINQHFLSDHIAYDDSVGLGNQADHILEPLILEQTFIALLALFLGLIVSIIVFTMERCLPTIAVE